MLVMILAADGGHDIPPFVKIKRKPEVFTPLPFGAIRPTGWLKAQMLSNLRGFTGHLDSLAPDLVIRDEIYGRDRLTRNIRRKDVGALAGGDTAAQVQWLWWNSETQGNWRDGFIRSAILTGDRTTLEKARAYVKRMLKTQDRDGYLGIYDKDLRYRFEGENGELWSKTTLLRGLLAWYEYTHDPAVLTAVTRAVDDVMRNYPVNTSHPFFSKTPNVGGLSHGLMFTDVLEALFRLTRRTVYLDYALFLYNDFSIQPLNEDARYPRLIDSADRLRGHGVHTYEHLRAVAAAFYASGSPALGKALDAYQQKIAQELTPSGAPAGDEWIGGRRGDATTTGYEYCSLQELMDSYGDLLGKTGAASYGDKIERIFFNAAQGARDPDASCIAYLKTDNSYFMTGGLNGDSSAGLQTRYKYSPVHQDVAVCCVPNAGRIAPYYVGRMWMRDDSGLVATVLGPCSVRTVWKGHALAINEKTDYPNGFSFDFKVSMAHAISFTLAIRKPSWADTIALSFPYTEKDGYILVTRNWMPGESLHLRFYPRIEPCKDRAGSIYFTYGPLVLAHPITTKATVTKRYPLPGFADYHYSPDNLVRYIYDGGRIESPGLPYPGFGGVRFRALLYDPDRKKEEPVWLAPMGGTILRQVTFPDNGGQVMYQK
jgi:DUF1680 family protein